MKHLPPAVVSVAWLVGLSGALLGLSAAARADLLYDLQAEGGGKTVLVSTVGQEVTLELHAILTGTPGNPALEGFWSGWGSFLSWESNGGVVQGDLTGVLVPPCNGGGSQPGWSQDLNGDGNRDVGSLLGSSQQMFFARTGFFVTQRNARGYNAPYTALPDGGIDLVMGKATYKVTSLVGARQPGASTSINFLPDHQLPLDHAWMQDGVEIWANPMAHGEPTGTVGQGTPVNVVIGGPPWVAPPPAVRWNYTPLPAKTADNLVVVTHGWVPSNSSDPTQTWVDGFVSTLKTRIDSAGAGSQWQEAGFKWYEAANFNAADAMSQVIPRAQEAGRALGQQIAAQHRTEVHLIGDNAGAALVEEAAKVVRALSPETTIQITFLDPMVSLDRRGVAEYGSSAAWADSYFAHDHDLGLHTGAYLTEGPLVHAHNVDVTLLDPNLTLNQLSPPSIYGPLNHAVSHADWPRQFYLASMVPGGISGAGSYGFPLSLEGGGWDQRGNYPVGNAPIVLGGSGAGALPAVAITEGAAVDLAQTAKAASATGDVQVQGTQLVLRTGSPVWLTATLDVGTAANLITFDGAFTSDPGAEGVLSVFWNDQLLGTIDERYVLAGMQSYSFGLPQTFAPGQYTLTMRLDPFTDVQSTAVIDDIRPGLAVAVPEPAGLALVALAASVLLRRARGSSPA